MNSTDVFRAVAVVAGFIWQHYGESVISGIAATILAPYIQAWLPSPHRRPEQAPDTETVQITVPRGSAVVVYVVPLPTEIAAEQSAGTPDRAETRRGSMATPKNKRPKNKKAKNNKQKNKKQKNKRKR